MRHVRTLLCLSLLVFIPATAAPTISVTPSSIDTLEVNPVRVDVTNIVGATIVLRLRVDVDGDGVADPEDYLIWSDVVDDDATEWSPNMLADEDADPGEVTVRPRLFTPLKYPNAVGNYLWEVEDAAAASPFDRVAFGVTQTTGAQSVSGTVSDGGLPVGGALVLLLPINEDCDAREYTAFTDAAGNYSLELAAGLACEQRVVLSARPGYVGGFLGQPNLQFTGSDAFVGVDLTLSAGDWMVDGAVKYEDGPRVGQGIPGAFVFADGDDGFSVGFSDGDGGYDFMLTDGNWSIEVDEAAGLALQGAVYVDNRGVGVSVSGAPAPASDMLYPAANAFISGTLFDDGSTPLPALEVFARRNFPCEPDCFESEIFTAGDGSFTLGVIGPDLPDSDDYQLAPETPREGLVARLDTVAVSNGSNLPANIEHVTPTAWITGNFAGISGDPLSDLCLRAYSFTGLSYESRATIGCDGSYTLPVVDGSWQVGYEGTDLLGFYRDLDTGRVDRSVVVSGGNVSGIDFILGRFLLAPTVTRVEPPAAQSGAHVLLSGHALPGQSGQILVGGSPATVVASRPDLGKIVVEVPSLSGPGSAAVVVNDTDIGLGSNESCLEIQLGTYTPDCVLSGTATDSGVSPVAGAVVAVVREADDSFERLAVTDASGDWSAGVLAAGAPYNLLFLPPQGQGFTAASYSGLACGTTQDHTFLPGAEITGTVVDGGMQPIPFASVDVSDGVDTTYDTQLTDGQGAYSLRAPSASSVIVSARAPIGSRWVNQPGVALQTNTDPTFAPQIQLDTGSLFAGRVLGGVIAPLFVERDGVAARVIALPTSGLGFGWTETDQCSGDFAVAVQNGDYDLQIDPLSLPTGGPTQVSTVTVDGDALAEFDFLVFDESPLQYTGPEPRGSSDMDSRAQVGQPMLIRAENLGGTFASVRFPDGPTGLPGVDPVFDAARGLVLTRVPPGAQSGELVFTVDGTFSTADSSFPFILQPGVFDPGPFTLSGTITGSASPLSGALVILLTVDPTDPDCDPDGEINDYAVTDGAGNFTVSHPGGDVQLLVLPPTATTFSPAQDALNLAGDLAGYGNDLQPGQALTLRAVTGAPAVPVPNVTVDAEGSVFDLRLTAADGTATLYLPAGSYDVRLSGPYGSRLVGQQLMATAPVDLGDVALASGLLVGGRAVDVNADPVAGAFAEARGAAPPFDGFSEGQTDSNGIARGALPASTAYRLFLEGPTPSLADLNIDGDPRVTDLIGYPSVVLEPAGAIAGSITDLVTGAAVPQIDIGVNENVGGAFGAESGFGQSCDDGGYHVKVAVGAHFVGANTSETPDYYGSYYPSNFCSNVPGSVNAVEGLVTGSIDIELLPKTATPVCTVLGNVSTRGQVGTGADVLIGGFIVEGLTSKRVLVRALGPTLGGPPFNVPGALTNPQLTLTTVTGTPITSNDDWRTGGQEAEITATGFAPPNDLEPAVIVDLAPGAYTPIVSGVGLAPQGVATGVGIVEVYELDGSAIARLTNVSTRGQVGTGSDQLIGGFVVQGPGNKTVLVRALGPTLAGPPFNVPGALVNPQLILTTVGGSVLASNDDWSTGSQVSEISATGLAPPDGTEPAILIDLAPGAYTPIVSGVGGGTGVGIVEIYEIDP